jgi:hypothetical protein
VFALATCILRVCLRALSGHVRLNQSFISSAGGVGADAVASEREVPRGTAGPAETVHEEIVTGGKTRLGEKSLYESRTEIRYWRQAEGLQGWKACRLLEETGLEGKRLKRGRGRRRRRGALRQRFLVVACNTNAHTLLTSFSLHAYLTGIKVVCSLSAPSLQARLWYFLSMPKSK